MTEHSSHSHSHAHNYPQDLTRNQLLVLDALEKSKSPLSAYSLLEQLRSEGLRAPLQVYRALDKLVAQGLVHRLESLSAFMACQHPECAGHAVTVFMICDNCGGVTERTDIAVGEKVTQLAQQAHFRVNRSSIEVRGLCENC